MGLLAPVMIRLTEEQRVWLAKLAETQGHGNKSLVLRLILDNVMHGQMKRHYSPGATMRRWRKGLC